MLQLLSLFFSANITVNLFIDMNTTASEAWEKATDVNISVMDSVQRQGL